VHLPQREQQRNGGGKQAEFFRVAGASQEQVSQQRGLAGARLAKHDERRDLPRACALSRVIEVDDTLALFTIERPLVGARPVWLGGRHACA